ncbi:hypothetical protein [Pseudoduganella aquatica]|uniref:HEPN domain-containing protein n=1 Tax=Pseudoduganella aquatica TaxID=2660641 RepID=A0A7X4HH21_9BURK|nr:hypothetical protein [Pseudoduganella aquatica]MYN10357.1 hypothetical protein [Pseudoduganella aquatica]
MVTPAELLSAANSIGQQAGSEATIRSAISRYYYAAYHCSQQFHAKLAMPGQPGRAHGRHNQLISQLANPSPQLPRHLQLCSLAVSHALFSIRNLRIPADYHLNTTFSNKELHQAAQLAATIFALT